MKTFREYLVETRTQSAIEGDPLKYMEDVNRKMLINVDGVDFKMSYFWAGHAVTGIGTSSRDTVKMTAIHDSGLSFTMDVKENNISIINTSQKGSSYIPVNTKKAVEIFNGEFNGVSDITTHNYVLAKSQQLEASETSKKLITKFKKYIQSELKYIQIEGSLFFDNTQQNKMNEFKQRLIKLGLTIDNKTRSVLEFSGDVIFVDDIKNLIKELGNSSYYINK